MNITVAGADAVVADLTGYHGKVNKGAVRALNRALIAGRTAMARDIAGDTGIGVRDVTKALSERRATIERAEAAFGATIRRIPLIYFKARQTATGVTARLTGGAGQYPSAFIARMRSGHEGVFQRKFIGSIGTRRVKRLSIVELFGPSLGHVFAKHRPAGLARTMEAFDTAFAHELQRLTSGQESPNE